MPLETGQSGTRFRSLGTTGGGAQSPTYFDPKQRRSMLFNTKEYDTPQYTAAGPIAVDTTNNINAGPRVFGRAGATGPESLERLKWERNNQRMMNYGKTDEAIEKEYARRERGELKKARWHDFSTDRAAAQRNIDERDLRAASDRDQYGISDDPFNRMFSGSRLGTGLNPYSRLTDLTRMKYPDPGVLLQESINEMTTGLPTPRLTDNEWFDKLQQQQANKDRIRLGSYVYNDTLRELWEGDTPPPTINQWGRAENPDVPGVGWAQEDTTFATENPFEDKYSQRYVAPGSGFNTAYKTPPTIGNKAYA